MYLYPSKHASNCLKVKAVTSLTELADTPQANNRYLPTPSQAAAAQQQTATAHRCLRKQKLFKEKKKLPVSVRSHDLPEHEQEARANSTIT